MGERTGERNEVHIAYSPYLVVYAVQSEVFVYFLVERDGVDYCAQRGTADAVSSQNVVVECWGK
jgi:hypothetical protein